MRGRVNGAQDAPFAVLVICFWVGRFFRDGAQGWEYEWEQPGRMEPLVMLSSAA